MDIKNFHLYHVYSSNCGWQLVPLGRNCPLICDSKNACNYSYLFLMHKQPCQVNKMRAKETSSVVRTWFLMTMGLGTTTT